MINNNCYIKESKKFDNFESYIQWYRQLCLSGELRNFREKRPTQARKFHEFFMKYKRKLLIEKECKMEHNYYQELQQKMLNATTLTELQQCYLGLNKNPKFKKLSLKLRHNLHDFYSSQVKLFKQLNK